MNLDVALSYIDMALPIVDIKEAAVTTKARTLAAVVSVILGIARGVVTLGFVLTLIFVTVVPFAKDRLDMEVDAAIKMVVSLGVVVPQWTAERIRELPLEMPAPDQTRRA